MRHRSILIPFVLLTVMSGVLSADSVLAISSGIPERGTLTRSDDTLSDGSHYHIYRINARRGDVISVTLTSEDFDTYLMVIDDGEFREDNDDREGGGTNSALSFTVDQQRDFYLVATSYEPGATGAYTLTATVDARTVATQTVAAGALSEQMNGSLRSGDRELTGGEYYDSYEFLASAGDLLAIELESEEFDTYLILIEPDGEQVEIDDARGSTNSYLERVLAQTGAYEILATSYAANETGSYALSYQTTPAGAEVLASSTQELAFDGNLQPTEEVLARGEYVHRYAFRGEAGQSVRFELSSTEFDSYLILQGVDGSWILENDDADPNTLNSRIDLRLKQAGEYQLLVTSYDGGETGRYELASTTSFISTPSITQSAVPMGRLSNTQGYYGIFVGISDYPGTGSDLDFCAADAAGLNRVFLQNGYASDDRVTLLRDRQATRSAMLGAIEEYASRIRRDETLVLFFSGHGSSIRSSSERDGSDETIELYDGAILDDELAQALSAVDGRVVLVLDACYSAGFAKDVITRPGWFGIFSSAEDVVSYVADEFEAGGYLSYFFQRAISGGADGSTGSTSDMRVSMAELERYLLTEWYGSDGPSASSNQHLRFERNGVSVEEVLFEL